MSGLLPQFGTIYMKGRLGQIGLICIGDYINEEPRGQKCQICTRESNDGDKSPQSAPVKFNVKDHGGKRAGFAPVNLGASAGIGAL